MNLVSTSMTYVQSPLIMVVPPGSELSSMSKLLSPFHDTTWYLIYCMMLIVILIMIVLKFQSKEVRSFVYGKQITTPFLNIVNVIVGLPMHKTPGRNFARWILTMLVIKWLIIRSLYQAVLYKELQSTERNHPVQSVQESLNLGFVYYMLASTQDNIKSLPEVYNRRVVVTRNESFEVLKEFKNPLTRAAFLGGYNSVRYSNKVNLYGFPLTMCREVFMQRQYSVVFPKGSFLVRSFDQQLIVLMENGLIYYWVSEHTSSINQPRQNAGEPIKLTLNHLLSAYQLMLFGVCLASTIFIVELLSMRVKPLRKFCS